MYGIWMLKLLILLSVATERKGKPGDYNDDIYDNDDIPTIVGCHVSCKIVCQWLYWCISDIYIYFRHQRQFRVAQWGSFHFMYILFIFLGKG